MGMHDLLKRSFANTHFEFPTIHVTNDREEAEAPGSIMDLEGAETVQIGFPRKYSWKTAGNIWDSWGFWLLVE